MAAARYFVIENDTITNAIMYDPGDEYDPGEDAVLQRASRMPAHLDIGWRKVGGVWTAPDPVEPDA